MNITRTGTARVYVSHECLKPSNEKELGDFITSIYVQSVCMVSQKAISMAVRVVSRSVVSDPVRIAIEIPLELNLCSSAHQAITLRHSFEIVTLH